MSILVDRCVCFRKTFRELRQIADEHGCRSIQELQDHVTFGMACQMCHPYVVKMLTTRQTQFTSLLFDTDKSSQDGGDDPQP